MAKSERKNLTKRTLAALRPGPERRTVFDEKTPGLCVIIYPTGQATWFVYRRVKGRPVRTRIGSTADVTPENARREAQKLNGLIARGIDPNDQRREERGEPTLGDLWEAFERFSLKRRRPKTVHDYRLIWEKRLKQWRNRKLSAVRTAEIATLHEKIGQTAPISANRMLSLVSAMFSRGQLVGYKGDNPASDIERFRENKRERFLTAEELPRFLDALDADESPDARDFFLVSLFTGARRGNIQSMRWKDVDLKAGVWVVPAQQAKAGESLRVHLPDAVLDVLKRRKKAGQYVFPSARGDGHLKDPMPWWRRICERAGLENITPHDLRRTLGSWQAAHGASLPVIGKTLGHRDQASTAIYSRLDLSPVKVSVDATVNAMLAAGRKNNNAVAGKIGGRSA